MRKEPRTHASSSTPSKRTKTRRESTSSNSAAEPTAIRWRTVHHHPPGRNGRRSLDRRHQVGFRVPAQDDAACLPSWSSSGRAALRTCSRGRRTATRRHPHHLTRQRGLGECEQGSTPCRRSCDICRRRSDRGLQCYQSVFPSSSSMTLMLPSPTIRVKGVALVGSVHVVRRPPPGASRKVHRPPM